MRALRTFGTATRVNSSGLISILLTFGDVSRSVAITDGFGQRRNSNGVGQEAMYDDI